jgi:DNA-binding response OmpR family regulator
MNSEKESQATEEETEVSEMLFIPKQKEITILIVEDEKNIRELVEYALLANGFEIKCFSEGAALWQELRKDVRPELILLDIMLPGINGYELMDYAKACELPVIFLTALGSTEHKVKGLRMGADDYLPKPFEIVELLARVEAVLRRYHKTETMIQVNNVTIDTASHRVTLDGEEIYLTPKEFDLLLLFARNKNRALYRETIYETVWGGEYMGQSRTVDLHVQRLKKKLHWEEMVVAVYKVGYRLNEVRS